MESENTSYCSDRNTQEIQAAHNDSQDSSESGSDRYAGDDKQVGEQQGEDKLSILA